MGAMTRRYDWNPSGPHAFKFRTGALVATGLFCVGLTITASIAFQAESPQPPENSEQFTIVVMDPLSSRLACDCVEAYAQRNYDMLGAYIEEQLGRTVNVVYADSLQKGVLAAQPNRVDLIVGKRSLVEADLAACNLAATPLAMLTDQQGSTTLTGLFVVPSGDPARTIADLSGYRIIFGPSDSAEKHSAAVNALEEAGVTVADQLETSPACTEAAITVLDNEEEQRAAAVISSYAMAIMEGCGGIEKDSLRVIGRTDPVPFVTVFAATSHDAEIRQEILDVLTTAADMPELLVAMETKEGFIALDEEQASMPNSADSLTSDWPQWRGPDRTGVSPWLPRELPNTPKILWRRQMNGVGLSGIVATGQYVIVADRDSMDLSDIFRCLDAEDGHQIWEVQYRAPGNLDYGSSPRAAPVIHDNHVYLLGAFGHLNCVNLEDGQVVWDMSLLEEFGADVPTWGICSSPLIVDDLLIVNPGAEYASLVALDRLTGRTVWSSEGEPAAYSSFIVGEFGGTRQIVGYDSISLGGWDAVTGERLWSLIPPESGDFNVPTSIDAGGKILVSTENNGTRLYDFDSKGKIVPEPVATHEYLSPDTGTPVLIDGKVLGCWYDLYCLDLNSGLREQWIAEDEAFERDVTIIGGPDRILLTSSQGELLLIDTTESQYNLVSRLQVCDEDSDVLSHPALVGNRLYIRDTSTIYCVSLE
jgi:ABC-type phosphate/phosphonate transport system substrate-binding protein/outer membrane protein assembly factor BamB